MTNISDKAGEEYWSKVWSGMQLAPPVNVHDRNINNYPYRILHPFYKRVFSGLNTSSMHLLEVGCGNSSYMTYLGKEFGFAVSGLDYSEIGCEQTRQILKRDGVDGTVILGDAFNPPSELLGHFDVVCSYGVVEHFEDTSETLKAFSLFLKPGGILITSVPNMAGVTGYLQKVMNRPVYDIHVPMDKEFLDAAIAKAGLKLVESKYFLSVSFAVELGPKEGKLPFYWPKKIFLKAIRYGSKLIWLLESFLGSFPERRLWSGGIISAAKRPG